MTWTLILFISAVNGYPATAAVPGFSSEKSCREVGDESVSTGRATVPRILGFLCIRVR